jgi:hypothetical protein
MDNPIIIEIETPEEACDLMDGDCTDCPAFSVPSPSCQQELFNLIRERGMIVKVKEG